MNHQFLTQVLNIDPKIDIEELFLYLIKFDFFVIKTFFLNKKR